MVLSKSLGNYIGINEDASDIYTKVMKIPDELIIKYYELCTDVHPDEIEKIKTRMKNGENPRDIKMELAKEITTLYHDEEKANQAEENFKTAFQKQQAPENTPKISFDDANENKEQELLNAILSSGKYKSKGEIRRLFMQGAVKVNGNRVEEISKIEKVENGDIIQIGKGNFFEIKFK